MNYDVRINAFISNTDWLRIYTDDSYREIIKSDFLQEFSQELESNSLEMRDNGDAYGRFFQSAYAHILIMDILGLEFSRSGQGNVTIVDAFSSRYGWLKAALTEPPVGDGHVSQSGATGIYLHALGILSSLQSAVSSLRYVSSGDASGTFAASRLLTHVFLEGAGLVNNVYYSSHLNISIPSNSIKASVNKVGLYSGFLLSNLAQALRMSILSGAEPDAAFSQSAQMNAGAATGTAVGFGLYGAQAYLSALKGRFQTLDAVKLRGPNIYASSYASSVKASQSLSSYLRVAGTGFVFAAGILSIGSLANMLNSDKLSDEEKDVVKAELGIQSTAVVSGFVLEGLLLGGLVTGPVGLLANAGVAVLASLSPATWLSIDLFKQARDSFASQIHLQSGTDYVGNSTLASLYDYKAFAATLQAVPIPFMREILGWIANDEIGVARDEERDELIGRAYNMSGGMQRIYEGYLQNVLSDSGRTASLREYLGTLIQSGNLERAMSLQTLWTPTEMHEYAAYSHSGLWMPDAQVMAADARSSIAGNTFLYDAISPQFSTLRGHDFDRRQWISGHDFLGSGLDFQDSHEQATDGPGLRFEVKDGGERRQFLSEEYLHGEHELAYHLANSSERSYHDAQSDITYQFVNEAVFVDYGGNPVINLSEFTSAGGRQFVTISGILSSPTNQVRFTPDPGDRPYIDVGYQLFHDTSASYIWRADEWSRAWNFMSGDVATTFDMGIQVTPKLDDVSKVTMGNLDDTLILGNRPVHAELGGGSNTVDYSKIGRGADDIRISVATHADGTMSVTRLQNGGPMWVEQVTPRESSWSHGQNGRVDHLEPVNVGVTNTGEAWQLTDTFQSVTAIRGTSGNDKFQDLPPGLMKIIASGGNDGIRTKNPISLDYSTMAGGITVNFSLNPSTGEIVGTVNKLYVAEFFSKDGHALDVNGQRVANTGAYPKTELRHGFDAIEGKIVGIAGSRFADLFNLSSVASDMTIIGGGGSDTIHTGGGNNTVVVSDGNVDARTGGGDDTFVVRGHNVAGILSAGAGFDTIAAMTVARDASGQGVYVDLAENTYGVFASTSFTTVQGFESVIGSEWDDWLEGDNERNMLAGQGGSDRLHGYGGDDVLLVSSNFVRGGHAGSLAEGGEGNDWIVSKTNKLFFVEDRLGGSIYDTVNDTLDGGSGTDTVDFSYAPEIESHDIGLVIDVGENGVGYAASGNGSAGSIDTLISIEDAVGTAGSDRIYGSDGSNVLDGAGGDDSFDGRDGDDTIRTGFGSSAVDGGKGFDTIDYSNLPINAEAGAAGVDINLVDGTASKPRLNVAGGVDRLVSIENVLASDANDVITGNAETRNIWALDGDDLIFLAEKSNTIALLGAGNKRIEAGDQSSAVIGYDLDFSDFIKAGGAKYGVSVDLEQGKIAKGVLGSGIATLGTDTIVGEVSAVMGTVLDDRMIGNADDNAFLGGLGDNFLDGKGGDNWLMGGLGNDTLVSGIGSGNDILEGGGGSDVYKVLLDRNYVYDHYDDVSGTWTRDPNSMEFDMSKVVRDREVTLMLSPVAITDRNVLEINSSTDYLTFGRDEDDLIVSSVAATTSIRIHDWYGDGGRIQALSLLNQPNHSGPLMIEMAQLEPYLSTFASGQKSVLPTDLAAAIQS